MEKLITICKDENNEYHFITGKEIPDHQKMTYIYFQLIESIIALEKEMGIKK